MSLSDPLAGRLKAGEKALSAEVQGQLKSSHVVRWPVDGIVPRKRLCLFAANNFYGEAA